MSKNKIYGLISLIIILLITLIIVFSSNSKDTFNVYFNSNGGTIVETQKVIVGDLIEIPNEPTKENFHFVCWELDGEEFDFNALISFDIELTAKWSETEFLVTFIDSDDVYSTQTVLYNNVVNKPNVPTKEGYCFMYWTLNGTQFYFDTKITKNITLEAYWEEITEETIYYDLTYIDESDLVIATFKVVSGSTIVPYIPANKEGLDFNCWNSNGYAFNFDTLMLSDITLKGSWNIKKYNVTFDTQGGLDIPSIVVEHGNTINIQNPTKNNSIFSHWEINNIEFDINSEVTSDLILTAVWI